METIGLALTEQDKKWQDKVIHKLCLDTICEDLRRTCATLRRQAKSDRLLLHYNGHGVPRPTESGELWVFGRNYSHYMPLSVADLRSWLGDPAIFVLDCSGAGMLLPYLLETPSREERASWLDDSLEGNNKRAGPRDPRIPSIVLCACKATEVLPIDPVYPADLFTCCLTTPIRAAVLWFILQVRAIILSRVTMFLCSKHPVIMHNDHYNYIYYRCSFQS